MSALQQIIHDLHDVEEDLRDRPALAKQIRAIAALLAGDDLRWIDRAEAERILDVGHPATIDTWVRLGLLRGRPTENGELQVSLEDVLRERDATSALDTGDDRELSADELTLLGKAARDETRDVPRQ